MGEATEEPRTLELEDFDPETGHRHLCPYVAAGDDGTEANPTCPCLVELYATAARRLDASAVIDKIGPVDGDNILVVRGAESLFGDELVKELVRCAKAKGLTGPAAAYVPLVVILAASQSIEVLDEAEMNKVGWHRMKTGMGRPIPAGPYL